MRRRGMWIQVEWRHRWSHPEEVDHETPHGAANSVAPRPYLIRHRGWRCVGPREQRGKPRLAFLFGASQSGTLESGGADDPVAFAESALARAGPIAWLLWGPDGRHRRLHAGRAAGQPAVRRARRRLRHRAAGGSPDWGRSLLPLPLDE